MDETRIKRLRYRAWHRGTREADLMVGGFFDAHHRDWSEAELAWFEALIEEQDVDIMAWAIGSLPCPPEWEGPMMARMRVVSYVPLPT
jgi:antitoxin CptB